MFNQNKTTAIPNWDIEAQYQALRLNFFIALTAFVSIVIALTAMASVAGLLEDSGVSAPSQILFLIFTLVTLYYLTQKRYVSLLSTLILLSLGAVAWIVPLTIPAIAMAVLAVMAAAVFADSVLFAILLAGVFLRVIGLALVVPDLQGAFEISTPAAVFLAAILVVSALLVRYFLLLVRRMAFDAGHSASLLETTAALAGMFLTVSDQKVLLNRLVTSVIQKLGYDYAQVFLLSADQTDLRLEARAGEMSNLSFQPGDTLDLKSDSSLARSARTGDEINQINLRSLPGEFLVPNARARLITPILDGENILGVFDVQRTTSEAFSPGDAESIRVLLTQLGTTLKNAQLQEMQNASVQENKRLFMESQASLREIQRLNQELTRRAWDQYLSEEKQHTAVEVTHDGVRYELGWSSQMIEAGRQRAVTYSEDSSVLAIPIVLRGEVLGVVEIEIESVSQKQEALDIVQSVVQRLAISLDNARLFEEAQRSTLQEQRINMIASEFEAANSVDDLLQIALTELSESLGAKQGKIRLSQPYANGQANGSHEETTS